MSLKATPLLPRRQVSEAIVISDDDDDDSSKESGEISDGDGDSTFYNKEPILLTVKNALVDFLHEIDPSYGDLITFPIFQEFVRSHSSTLVYNPKQIQKASTKRQVKKKRT